jgi:hypothetical protein
MYAAIYIKNDKIEYVAFHDEKRVVKKYIDYCNKYNDLDLKLVKIKRKKAEKVHNFSNLYLIKYQDTYIQNGYTEYADVCDVISDYQSCKDTLLAILETYDLSKKERKAFEKVILYIDDIISDDKKFTPSLDMLKEAENDIYPYIYKVRYGDRYE